MRMLFLAARNLTRNLRRTVLTLVAIAFGLGMMMMMVTLQSGQYKVMLEQAISTQAGHVVVENVKYTEEAEPEYVVPGASGVVAAIGAAVPGAVVAPRIQMPGLISSPKNSVGVGMRGLDPEAEAAVTEMEDKIVRGEWLRKDDPQGVLLGVNLADRLGVDIGEKVVFMGQASGREVESRLLRVRGVFKSGSSELDSFMALSNLEPVQIVLGTPDAVHQITVHIEDPTRSEAVRDVVKGLIPQGTHALTWNEALPDLVAFIRLDRVSGDIMMLVLGAIVAMGVLNTILMSVLERTREFGVLLALGMRPRRIAGLVLLEGLVLGILGGGLGFLFGCALSWYLVVYGLDYTAFIGESMEMEGIVISALMKGAWDIPRSLQFVLMAVVFTVAASVYPAWHLFRLRPVEAMRQA
ncbi:MAG: ABC transporter permease [Myxococcales bacterium]|nr:ABC transporter permease [Myxococcales bacterium]MCB9672484.1 ABC transporter permease [Alphaproteobacteria bacterium]MCB9691735.1 ABC transporter permease [Alphaproteobacteria bacterium]